MAALTLAFSLGHHASSGMGSFNPMKETANYQYVDGLLRQGNLAANPGARVSSDHTVESEEQGVLYVRLQSHLPQESQSNASTAIAVLV